MFTSIKVMLSLSNITHLMYFIQTQNMQQEEEGKIAILLDDYASIVVVVVLPRALIQVSLMCMEYNKYVLILPIRPISECVCVCV